MAAARSSTDRWTPAIAGAAQIVQRPPADGDLSGRRGPIELMVEAARAAAADAVAPGLLGRVGWIGVAGGWWRYRNPARLVAERIGLAGVATALAPISGSSPQELVGLAAERIARGELDCALVLGGEARWTAQRLRRAGEKPNWVVELGDGEPETTPGLPAETMTESEVLGAPAVAYALLDDSLRVARGDTMEAHREQLAALWAGFGAVAAGNPYAWDRSGPPAGAIGEPSPANRMIAFPYTKAMVANNTVDMASAVLLCSVEAAAAVGCGADRLVFPHVVTSAHETWQLLHRHTLHETPALAAAGKAALAQAGIEAGDVGHVDLYACFPTVVRMSAAALGFGLDRPLTVTGGLGFAGGPVGNAAGQAIAAMVPKLRAGGYGVVHANGGNATKHAFGVYADHPPDRFVRRDCQSEVDLRPRQGEDDDWVGTATVEAATVVFDREGPSHVQAAMRTEAGRRVWATSRHADLIDLAQTAGLAGLAVHRRSDGDIGALGD